MKKKKKALAIFLSLSLGLASLTGCGKTDDSASAGSGDSSSDKLVINIGEQTEYLWSYMSELGYVDEFEDEYNVEFNLTFYSSGPNMNDAYSANAIDFATMGCQPALSGAASGRGYKIFARCYGQEHNSPLIAATDSGINSIEDLKGKKIGTYVGGTWQYYLNVYLASVGLTEDDVELFNTAAETATAIREGEVDAAVIGLSTAYILEDEGSAYIVSNEPGVDSPNVITVRDGFAEEYPEITKAVAELYQKGVDAIADDVESYARFVADKQELDEDIVVKAFVQNEYKAVLEDTDVDNLEKLYDYMVTNELVSDDGKGFDSLFDLTLIE
jgi:sulfonate transport system substrate-binding protein